VTTPPSRRQRLIRGAQGQLASHVARVIVQVGTVSALTAAWGLNLYGDWLILAAIPVWITFSETGLFAAASNDMIMRVARDDREGALRVFRATSATVALITVGVALFLVAFAAIAPVVTIFNLSTMNESTAAWVLVTLGMSSWVAAYANVLYGGFASVGRQGEGAFLSAGVLVAEFSALAGVAIAGGSAALASTAMLLTQISATTAMYRLMRWRAPWLRLGRAPEVLKTMRGLLSPTLASAAFPGAFALNVQGMVILVGLVLGPASAAVFSILRTMSRIVIQLLASIFAVVSPELSRAYAENDAESLRGLNRQACQAAVWLAAPIILFLAIFGGPIVHAWTAGKVDTSGVLLYLFLAVAAIDSLWFTNLAVVFARNEHQRLAVYYLVASALNFPVAFVLLHVWGIDGGAASLVLVELFMLVVVLREALPAAHDTLRGWLSALIRPPHHLVNPAALLSRSRGPVPAPDTDATR
jgi:O-antigen/teichoic acid export membrane protein